MDHHRGITWPRRIAAVILATGFAALLSVGHVGAACVDYNNYLHVVGSAIMLGDEYTSGIGVKPILS